MAGARWAVTVGGVGIGDRDCAFVQSRVLSWLMKGTRLSPSAARAYRSALSWFLNVWATVVDMLNDLSGWS